MTNNKIVLQEESRELLLFPCIEHVVEEVSINQRASDGYIDGTALCGACNKQVNDWLRLNSTKEFLDELSTENGISRFGRKWSRTGY